MPPQVKFSVTIPAGGRIHHVNEQDVCVVLGRLPEAVRDRLRAVHFNDRARGARTLGYVNRGRREIALCALPPRVGLTAALAKGQTPEMFGARRAAKWPVLAIRRFMLYDVLLHELGHLQIIDEDARAVRRKFAHEKLAEAFAMEWCKQLWSEPFAHADPVHNRPSADEMSALAVESDRHTAGSHRGVPIPTGKNITPASR